MLANTTNLKQEASASCFRDTVRLQELSAKIRCLSKKAHSYRTLSSLHSDNVAHGVTFYSTETGEITCQVKLFSRLAVSCPHITFWPKKSAMQVLEDMDCLCSCTGASTITGNIQITLET